MTKKVLKFIAGFIVGCIVMLVAIIGMYYYMASREPAYTSSTIDTVKRIETFSQAS